MTARLKLSAMKKRQETAFALKLAMISSLGFVLANCASQPQKSARSAQQSREIGAFSDPKYGKASPRLVDLDSDAPKGGGRQQVGKPYTVAGKRYVPREKPVGYTATGNASWYGIAFHGRKTANGEIYDRNSISAAHPTMPLPSYARVTNTRNNRSIVVRVNDRGPYHGGRILDVSERTAGLLEFKHLGTARIKVDYLGPAALAGSDDRKLIASLNTNGPAVAPAISGPVMVASAAPVASAVPQQSSALAFTSAPRVQFSAPPLPQQNVITATTFQAADDEITPPKRPFDLQSIGNAGTPVPMPGPSRLPRANPTELSFEEPSGLLSRFGAAGSIRSEFGPAR